MIKDQIKSNKSKIKFVTITLSVIFTMLFVFLGVKASFLGTSLTVDRNGDFGGGINVKSIYVPDAVTPKFSVDASGNVNASGNLTVGSVTYYGNPPAVANGLLPANTTCTITGRGGSISLVPTTATVYNSSQFPVLYSGSIPGNGIGGSACVASVSASRSYTSTGFGSCSVIYGTECDTSGGGF